MPSHAPYRESHVKPCNPPKKAMSSHATSRESLPSQAPSEESHGKPCNPPEKAMPSHSPEKAMPSYAPTRESHACYATLKILMPKPCKIQ
jgi:hypothetical protein